MTDDDLYDPRFAEIITDPRFRLLGFSMSDLRKVRHLLNVLDTDLAGLAVRVGVKLS